MIIRHTREKQTDDDTVVSEIVDCDKKTLPDVIPANVSDTQSQGTRDCDITANLITVDMDTTEDTNASKNERKSSEMDLAEDGTTSYENVPDKMVQGDVNKSLEEKRAEFYYKEHIDEIPSESVVKAEVIDEERSDDIENSNHNNATESESNILVEDLEIPKREEIRIPCESNDSYDETVVSTEESESSDTVTEHVHIHLDNSSDFDSFQYWRTPIPQVEVDLAALSAPTEDNINSVLDSHVKSGSVNVYDSSSGLTLGLSDSLNDLTVCDNHSTSVMSGAQVAIEHDSQLGDLGQVQSGETTMTVIDGVVQGMKPDGRLVSAF